MKRVIAISTVVATLLLSTALQADALHDSVAQKAEKALLKGKVKGERTAKAFDEEVQEKLLFKTKEEAARFVKDAYHDEAQRINFSVAKEVRAQQKNYKEAPREVFVGLNKTMDAINALAHHDVPTAKKALQKATASFDAALKANPKLKLVPIANEIDINAFEGSIDLIKKAVRTADSLLRDHEVQTARAILLPLEDDIIVNTQYIPMDIYPVATKDALKALDAGKPKKALALLVTGLSTMVVDTVVIPIPLLVAQDLVTVASQMDKTKKKEVLALLDAAQTELQKAVLLGYTKKHAAEYRAIQKEIKALKREIEGKNRVAKLYEQLKESFAKLLKHTRGDVTQNKAEIKVQHYQMMQQKKALEEKNLFTKEAIQDLHKTVN
jgi:hypothetical protein